MTAPELCCVVMSCGNEPGLERAVRSVLAQDVAVETVVVNCGGGDAAERLRGLGIAVPVWECEERLNPGALRNRGIEMTSAPFVSFLAADCVAEPGWARERVRHHLAGDGAVASALVNADRHSAVAHASFLLLFHTRMPQAPEADRALYGVSYARELFEGRGGFREDLRTGEDSEFNARLGDTPIAWAPEVLTGHGHPVTAGALIREHFARGARMARTRRRLSVAPAHAIAERALENVRPAARASRRLRLRPQQRARVLAALPLGAVAYGAGAIASGATGAVGDRARRMLAQVAVPSAGPGRRAPVRIVAVAAVRDELPRLPEFVAGLSGHVDAIVALDDGSSDGSAEWLEACPHVAETLRAEPGREGWNEMANHRRLVEAALRHRADWIVAVDADELLEDGFRPRAERVIERGKRLGLRAYALRVRELWGDREHYRGDGVWGAKRSARLFEARRDHVFDERALHGFKASLDAMLPGLEAFALADLELHHLAMLTPEDRARRRARYERLDPEARWQPEIGYAYMTDEDGLELRRVKPNRGWGAWLAGDGRRALGLLARGGRKGAGRLRSAAAVRATRARAVGRARAARARDLVAAAGVPSAGVGRRRKIRLYAVLAVRDEMAELPGLFASLHGEVDGVIALDDGSSDGSAEWLEAQPLVCEVIRVDPERPEWREMDNHRRLVDAAAAHRADWVLAIDADERLEPGFRDRAERVIARGRALGFDAFALRLRELWDSEDLYRADGRWARKAVARLFRLRADHVYDERPLHALKTPRQVYDRFGYVPIADLEIHHRGMLTPERRAARRARYERMDPDGQWQPGGDYAYLTDAGGLHLAAIDPGRGWRRWARSLATEVRSARAARQAQAG